MKTVIYAVTTFIMMSSPVTLCHRNNSNSDKSVTIQKMTDLRTCFTIAWNELFGIIPDKELQKFLPKVSPERISYTSLLSWCWWPISETSLNNRWRSLIFFIWAPTIQLCHQHPKIVINFCPQPHTANINHFYPNFSLFQVYVESWFGSWLTRFWTLPYHYFPRDVFGLDEN